jgi:KipI family sensor histidine kinase inhibitor
VAVYFGVEPQVDSAALAALAGLRDIGLSPRTVDIQAVYDGPDLADVARAAGVSESDVARIHAAGTYEVETLGFAPGFAYLAGVDPRLHVPRRTTPRPRVPAGSIALAGGFTGVYPFDSPGGWHLIGRVVGVRMFSEQGALLRLGDRVRFVP